MRPLKNKEVEGRGVLRSTSLFFKGLLKGVRLQMLHAHRYS